MRRPSPPGTAIDARRYRRWIERFGSYREGIINVTIESWLDQFAKRDRDLAARVLDSVDFYGQSQIHAAYRQTLAALVPHGWHNNPAKRRGKWIFAAMSRSAGESGDAMLYQFRLANRLDGRNFNELFVSLSDLFRLPMLPEGDPGRLGADDVVVLLDDFSGTGKQVCDAWNDPVTSFGPLLAGVGKVYLILVAASSAARRKIAADTSISTMPAHELRDSDNVFSDQCRHFTIADKARLLHYGRIANASKPRGFGDCGFVVVFQHRPPNNSLPILWASHERWAGIFPRHE
ncbi:MAG: hypothetical protein ABSG10_00425 [Terracidiphilus sp.]|jgi:hypothetical protein